MNLNKSLKLLTLVCGIVICFLIVSSLNLSNPETGSCDRPDHARQLHLTTVGSRTPAPGLGQMSTTLFTTNTLNSKVLGTPDGKTIYVCVPPEAEVTTATMQLRGTLQERINKYNVGERPRAMGGADLDQDGNIDLFATELNTHKFVILLGDGSLAFRYSEDYSTGDVPVAVTSNDFNNDNYPDIATANEGSNSITVYQNSAVGDGSFINRKDYKIGDMPRGITGADFNSDGWLDLAAVSSNDDMLWLSFNQKNGTTAFSEAVNYSIDGSPVAVTNGDFNNDGYPDIATIHVGASLTVNEKPYYNSISIFINDGTGGFGTRSDHAVGKKPANVLARDFNNDGWLDLATTNQAGYNVSVLLNDGEGAGEFNDAVNYPLLDRGGSGKNFDAGDIDGDGDHDIISICSSMNYITVLRNKGDGTFDEYVNFIAGQSPIDIFLSDLDNDGDQDVVTANVKDGTLSILPNNADGTYSTFEFYDVGGWPRGITHGDLDNDGDSDLATANYLGGSLTIRINDGNGDFQEGYDKRIAVEPFAVVMEDFDKDGDLDLASADEGLFELVIIFNNGTGDFRDSDKLSYDIGGYPYAILYHDFNEDGEKDLLTSNNGQNSIPWPGTLDDRPVPPGNRHRPAPAV